MKNLFNHIAAMAACSMMLLSCTSDEDGGTKRIVNMVADPKPIQLTEEQRVFANDNNGFTLNFLKTVNETDRSGRSFIYSPLSITYVLGMVNDLLVNNIFRYMRADKASYDPYMMFPQKKCYTFFCNILYYTLISAAVAYLYNAINLAAQAAGLVGEDKVWLTAEPVLYGVFILLLDMALLGIKALIKRAITNKASKKDTD